jgi:hypothetical protein
LKELNCYGNPLIYKFKPTFENIRNIRNHIKSRKL